MNKEKKEIISIDEVNLGIKILKSLTKRYIHLDNFSLKNIQFLDDIESENSKRIYKLKINNMFISSNDAIFSSKETTLNSTNDNLLISNRIGYLNNIPYKEVSIFKKIESPLYFYSANFELNEDVIEKEELVDLNQFPEKNINLNLVSKGYFDSAIQEITSINKYIFFNTKLVTQSGFEINDIEGILYTNIDERFIYIENNQLNIKNNNYNNFFLKDGKIICEKYDIPIVDLKIYKKELVVQVNDKFDNSCKKIVFNNSINNKNYSISVNKYN